MSLYSVANYIIGVQETIGQASRKEIISIHALSSCCYNNIIGVNYDLDYVGYQWLPPLWLLMVVLLRIDGYVFHEYDKIMYH